MNYNNLSDLEDKALGAFNGDTSEALDVQSMRQAKNTRTNRVIKKLLAVAAAVVPPFVMSYINGHGADSTPAKTVPAKPPVIPVEPKNRARRLRDRQAFRLCPRTFRECFPPA